MIVYKGNAYPTRRMKVHFKESDHTDTITVSTTDLNDAISEDVDNGVQEAIEIDGNIYFFLEPETEFFNPSLTHLDQPIEVVEEYFSHMRTVILENGSDLTKSETNKLAPEELLERYKKLFA